MRNNHAQQPTSVAPVWVPNPYTGKFVNVEPLLAYLDDWSTNNVAEKLDSLAFFIIDSVDAETMSNEPSLVKDNIYLTYQLRNLFNRIGPQKVMNALPDGTTQE